MGSAQTKTAMPNKPSCQPLDQKLPREKMEDEGPKRHESQMTRRASPNDTNRIYVSVIPDSQKNKMPIFFEMNDTDTSLDVKAKIQDKEGVPTSQQILFYKGEELDDRKSLRAQNFSNLCRLHVIFLQDDLQINVAIDNDEEIIKLKVKSWYTVMQVKFIIKSKVGVCVDRQSLYIDDENELDNNMTVAGYDLMQDQTLHMKYSLLQIFVRGANGKTTTLEVRLSDTIGPIKAKLTNGAPPRAAALIFNGRQLHDDKTIYQCGIGESNTIHLMYRLFSCKQCPR